MNQIYIKFLTQYLRTDKRKLASLIRRAMRISNPESQMTLSVVLVDNELIKKLNRRFLKQNRITDVLAFPFTRAEREKRKDERGEFGEIIVSVQKAYQEARRRKIPPDQEIILYCIHGLLHLLGYNDHNRKDRLKMWLRQEQILRQCF